MREGLVKHYRWGAAAAGAAGVACILVSELADIDDLRIVGALLITAGGIGTGIGYGLADPRRWPLQSAIGDWRTWIGMSAAILLSAPVVAALVAALLGVLSEDGRSANDATIVIGAVIAIVLTVAVVVSVALGIRVIQRAGKVRSTAPEPADGSTT